MLSNKPDHQWDSPKSIAQFIDLCVKNMKSKDTQLFISLAKEMSNQLSIQVHEPKMQSCLLSMKKFLFLKDHKSPKKKPNNSHNRRLLRKYKKKANSKSKETYISWLVKLLD